MNITLFNLKSVKNLLDKSSYLDEILTMEGTLKTADKGDVLNPTIIVESTSLISANYCYIKEFGRYYFITNITALRNNLYQLNMHVDVLMTYKDQIEKQKGIVARSTINYNPYLIDSQVAFENEYNKEIIESSEQPLFNWFKTYESGNTNYYPMYVLVGVIAGAYDTDE